ncbi:MAG TPA: transposase [Myxococcales bacterium]|nr:transposase [Myxococcales bacterium]
MDDDLKPADWAEELALFRLKVIGPLLCGDAMSHGELAAALRELSEARFRPPEAAVSRTYAVSTLERWLYAYRSGGLGALRPRRRSDRGHARALTDAQHELLLDIRRNHPRASASLIVRTLVADGRLAPKSVSAATVRRLYRAHGLDRQSLKATDDEVRRRWQATRPHALWHADVCHGPAMKIDGKSVPLRIHAILDDCTRHVMAIQACATERESEMLALVVKALRLHGAPDVLYLDNGSTYSGDSLATACGRLGVALVHAKPYDPQARGKMERFWRTLREQCLSYLGGSESLHDVQVRLLAWLDRHYHRAPHGGLMGKSPAQALGVDFGDEVSETMLREALTIRGRRRVRRDGTVSLGGVDFELDHGFLHGRVVTVARSLIDPSEAPWVEHEDRRLPLRVVDPVANGRRPSKRKASKRTGLDTPFDPPGALLAARLGKEPNDE